MRVRILSWIWFLSSGSLSDALVSFARPGPCAFSSGKTTIDISSHLFAATVNGLETSTSSSFTTPTMQVYIEDTDAYGVIYNANYLRIYDRALHLMSVLEADRTSLSPLLSSDSHDWSILAVESQKFKSSPQLGGSFVVKGELKDFLGDGGSERWELVIQSDKDDSAAVVYNTATVVIGHPDRHVVRADPFLSSSSLSSTGDPATTATTTLDKVTVFRDEFEAHMPTHLPLRNILNLFERSRTNFLGGPDVLKSLQQDENLLFVVTSVSDLALLETQNGFRAGQELTVQTEFIPKRQGMILECRHSLLSDDDEEQQAVVLAQGKVTIMTLDGRTKRPTSQLPAWLKKKLPL